MDFLGVIVCAGDDGYIEDVTGYKVFVHHVFMVRYCLLYALSQMS